MGCCGAVLIRPQARAEPAKAGVSSAFVVLALGLGVGDTTGMADGRPHSPSPATARMTTLLVPTGTSLADCLPTSCCVAGRLVDLVRAGDRVVRNAVSTQTSQRLRPRSPGQ